jgi:hypothetical protein
MIAVRLRKQAWFVACAVLAYPATMLAQSTEFIANEGPAPDSVEELHGPIVIAFPDAEERPDALSGSISEWLDDLSPFWSDAHANANFRTYYFLRDNGITALIEENEAWAAGGILNFESGKLWNILSVGGEYFASVPIDASDSMPGSGLLKPIQNTISTFGQGYVRGVFGKQVVTLGRQRINKPYLNGNDSRMLPNTFQGITLDGRWNRGRFFIGYVDKIKGRSSDTFIAMGRRVGVQNSDEGLWELGARYEWGEGNFIGAIASYIPDIMSTIYSELDRSWSSGGWGFRLGAQITDQRSVGDNLLTGTSFNTQSFGARFSAGIDNFIFTTVVSRNGDGAGIRSPFGGDPSFTSLMLSNFNLANQRTYRIGVSYTGTSFGYPGISGFINYAHGVDAEVGGTGHALPDNEEIDFTVDFHSTTGPLEGAWLRVRYGILNPGSSRKRYNVRITLNWGFQLL